MTPENKERWFQRLTPEERYLLFEEQLRLLTEANPRLRKRHAPDPSRSVRILRLPER